MTRESEMMAEGLSGLAAKYGWSLDSIGQGSYSLSVVLFKEDLAIQVTFELREAEIWCTCYWLGAPYIPGANERPASSSLFSIELHELISDRADRGQARRDRRRLGRSVRPQNEAAFLGHVEEVAALIKGYAPDILAGDHTAIQQLGRAGEEGRRRGLSSPERDAKDRARLRRWALGEKWGGIGCGVVIAMGILYAALSCHR